MEKVTTPLPACSFRPLTEDDLVSVISLESRSYPEPWKEHHFRAEMEKPYSTQWVLTDDETDELILGYIVFWEQEKTIEILNITVGLEWRGLGVGKRLLRQVAKHAVKNEADRLILDVRKSNLAAISLYQRCGFSIQQIRRAFYSNGEDSYHMVLTTQGAGIDF